MPARTTSPLLAHCSRPRRIGTACLVAVALTMPACAQNIQGKTNPSPIMAPWTTVTGGWAGKTNTFTAPGMRPTPQASGYLTLRVPSAVAARGNYVYVADSGHRQIYRYDLSQQSMTPFASFSGVNAPSMAVAADLSLYVTDFNGGKILHYSVDGRQLQTFSNSMEIARPVAVLVDRHSANLWVADAIYNQVVVFNSLGRVIAAQASQMGRAIVAMAQGPDGLYLADSLGRQVVVVGTDGTERYSLGKGDLKMPNAVAVDRYNRVFVSDSFDNTLKVFERGQLTTTVGGGGAIPASFNRITSLAIDQNTLYVADSLNARIQTFHLLAPARVMAPDDDE